MTAQSKQQLVITADQYHALAAPPVRIPTSQELFDYGVETLVGKGRMAYGDADSLRRLLPERGLFFPVPPLPNLSDQGILDELMAGVELDGVRGRNYLEPEHLKDMIEVPPGPYLLVDAEDGAAYLNVASLDAQRRILSASRSPYTVFEGIIHVTLFPFALKRHYMDIAGSRCSSGRVPCLCLGDGQPELDASWEGDANSYYGAASCGSRIVP